MSFLPKHIPFARVRILLYHHLFLPCNASHPWWYQSSFVVGACSLAVVQPCRRISYSGALASSNFAVVWESGLLYNITINNGSSDMRNDIK